ncbi:HupE/UreJ family protein [Chitinophaga oryziterrae]|nr:HupE/UreJ family protein [Chitinophaga oryziterrae]
MRGFIFYSRRTAIRWLLLALTVFPCKVFAHPMPNSFVMLDIKTDGVNAELQLPLSELQLAFGHDVAQNSGTLVARLSPELRAYLLAHIHAVSADGRAWTVTVRDLRVQPVEQSASGPYQELTAHLWLQPPVGVSTKDFTLNYDVIIHQLVTHKALVAIRQDWEKGVYSEQPEEVGVIRLDIPTGTILPLHINQSGGSMWRGFKSMVSLGMQHIAEGTDHLLFLLVLLLPAPLLVKEKRWGAFGGTKYSVIRLLKVVTAFTAGHSITLLAAATGWLRLPGQPVEVLIAISILVSAIHALRPVFSGKEAYIAAGFGLIHGMAFASTLANLDLDTTRMGLSILGFNIGIELMQLFVIAITVPWLILLSRTGTYPYIRIAGAILAAIAALAWIIQRVSDKTNFITDLVQQLMKYAPWMILLLGIASIISVSRERYGRKQDLNRL